MSRFPKPKVPHDYQQRAHAQCLSWALGNPYHEPVNDECCPDFSCCEPGLFTADAAERWRAYRAEYGPEADAPLRPEWGGVLPGDDEPVATLPRPAPDPAAEGRDAPGTPTDTPDGDAAAGGAQG